MERQRWSIVVIAAIAFFCGATAVAAQDAQWEKYMYAAEAAEGRGQHAEAVRNMLLGVKQAEKSGTKDLSMLVETLDDLALFYLAHHQYAEAEPVCLRSLEIKEKAQQKTWYQPYDYMVGRSLYMLSEIYKATGRTEDAAKFEQRLKILDRKRGSSDRPQTD